MKPKPFSALNHFTVPCAILGYSSLVVLRTRHVGGSGCYVIASDPAGSNPAPTQRRPLPESAGVMNVRGVLQLQPVSTLARCAQTTNLLAFRSTRPAWSSRSAATLGPRRSRSCSAATEKTLSTTGTAIATTRSRRQLSNRRTRIRKTFLRLYVAAQLPCVRAHLDE